MSNDPLDVCRSISFHWNLPGDGGAFDGRPRIGGVPARSATGRLRPRPPDPRGGTPAPVASLAPCMRPG